MGISGPVLGGGRDFSDRAGFGCFRTRSGLGRGSLTGLDLSVSGPVLGGVRGSLAGLDLGVPETFYAGAETL